VTESEHKPIYRHLYFQVLVAISIGVLLGHFFPGLAVRLKPLGDGFISRRRKSGPAW
jgi:aerobic C4-dicarboxylate transport protein